MAAPFVTVIINNYNYGRFIKQAIDSVLAQTYQDFELLVVDDGSTDESRAIISSYQDSRLIPVLKENGGQASAMNEGVQRAKGELIAFLDSDDWWTPDKLDTVVRWHKFLNGTYAFLQHGVLSWKSGNPPKIHPHKPIMYAGSSLEFMINDPNTGFNLFNGTVGSSGLTFSRAIMEKAMPIPLCLRVCADGYLMLACQVFAPVYAIPLQLGYYRQHQNLVNGNQKFDGHEYLRQNLYPHVNEFLAAHGFPELFNTPRHSHNLANLLVLQLALKMRFDSIFSKYQTVALFGAGSHTEWLSRVIGSYVGDHVSAILDEKPEGKQFWGKQAILPGEWHPRAGDAILLSSDCWQKDMKTRCELLFGHDVVLIDLYEGLPPGPYDK